ncbi:MAG: AbiH family protein [Pseudolactococcus laudensis]
MEITFLLGNGFDIQCGLKTSYIDFYKYILEKKYSIDLTKEMDKESISEIDNIIYSEIYKSRDKIETWADLEFQLGVFTKQLKEKNQDVQESANRFLDDFEILKVDLNEYLKYIQIQDDVEISEDFSNILFTTMDKFFENLFSREYDEVNDMLKANSSSHFQYNFISFNYTNSLEKIIQNCSDLSKK